MARTKQPAKRRPFPPQPPGRKPAPIAKRKISPKTVPPKGVSKFRPGSRALQEIRKYQQSKKLCIPKAPFDRVVREICDKVALAKAADGNKNGDGEYVLPPGREAPKHRWTPPALAGLREATEKRMVDLFESVNMLAIHARRDTAMEKDLLPCGGLYSRRKRSPRFIHSTP